MRPRIVTGRAMLLAGLRRYHDPATMAETIPQQWREYQARVVIAPGTTTYGAMCGFSADRCEYLSGIEVEDFADVPADLGRMRVPVQQYAVFWHGGPVTTIRETWTAIWRDWLPGADYQTADTPDFERYDERFDPVTGLGGVEIWLPIAAKGLSKE
jgi:AraC family transcriptional regulator